MKKYKILGVNISGTTSSEVLSFALTSLKEHNKFLIVTPNPEIIVKAQKNPRLMRALNSSSVSLPDGIGLLFAARILNQPTFNRHRGREAMLDLFDLASKNNLKIFLLGSNSQVIAKSLKIIKQKYPGLKAKGFSGPRLNEKALPAAQKDIAIEKDTLDQIDKYSPDLLFVAFGAPKQELWLHKHLSNLKVGGAMVVGGSLDYFSGQKPLPPKFLSGLGLEWFWRLLHEPGHAKRVFTALFVFPILIVREKLTA
jgi:N-acetylglucosaminyldiphosphoundecaprenol N-acetyl-beta-D-mannosaminyltransferase